MSIADFTVSDLSILTGFRQHALVDGPNPLQRAFIDVQIRKMRQEIVTDKDPHQDEIIDDPLEVVFEWYLCG